MNPKIVSVKFKQFKALKEFSLRLSHVNILVGPNNCGKSTLIASFRILAQAIRTAKSRIAVQLKGPSGLRFGWTLSEELLPIANENIRTNYEDVDSLIEFNIKPAAKLTIWFPASGGCYFFAERDGYPIRTRAEIKNDMDLDIQVVPVLGPVEHDERLVTEETVRKNLSTNRASRNFRNYWLKYPAGFEEFSNLVSETWPGMEVQPPERQGVYAYMFCLEDRMSRELYWSGFGFQIWLQLLSHVFRASDSSLIVMDEPEIYLHPDVQRQLLGILRNRNADILLATHSTEIMAEADPSEIVFINKAQKTARRMKTVDDIQGALQKVGSVQNITLSRLAANKRILFVEGVSDFRLLRRFASKLGLIELSTGSDITSNESGGFSSWKEIKALAAGFEKALGVRLKVAAIFDRDFWCHEEVVSIEKQMNKHLDFFHIHGRKEIENYLLAPNVLQRALEKAVNERNARSGLSIKISKSVRQILDSVTKGLKSNLQSQYVAKRVEFLRGSTYDTSTITEEAIQIFDSKWGTVETRMEIVRGKEVLAKLRSKVNELYSVSLSDHRIVTAFEREEIPNDLEQMLFKLNDFRIN